MAARDAPAVDTEGTIGQGPALVRLFRLWRLYAAMDLVWVTRDLRSVLLWLLSDTISSIATITGTLLLAVRFHGIGCWSTAGIAFMLGYALLSTGLTTVVFSYNVAYISRRIGRGQLDHLLIQPQPIWMALLTDGFAPISGAMELVPGMVLLLWAGSRLALHPSPGWLALFLVNLAASTAIAMSFSFLWGSLAFWAPRAAEEINSSSWQLLEQLKPFPLDGMGAALAGGLLTIVPVGFLAWYPCRALLGLDHTGYSLAVTPLAAVLAVALAAWVFRKGMKQYGRTGSQRYVALGHRG